MEFVPNEVYYIVTYASREQVRPIIDSVVFVGKNLSEDDQEDAWYFQDAQSFSATGSFLVHQSDHQLILCRRKHELPGVLGLPGLIRELSGVRS